MSRIKFETKPCKWCGEPVLPLTPIYKGRQYRRFRTLCEACHAKEGVGEFHPRWKGGKHPTVAGYIRIRTTSGNRRLEHHVVWEAAYGPIPRGYELHHIDRNPANNALENLTLLTAREHLFLHGKDHSLKGRWSQKFSECQGCGTRERPHKAKGYCALCYERRKLGWKPQRLREGRWALDHDACIECGTTAHRHEGHGLCQSCYRTRFINGQTHARDGRWAREFDCCRECGTTEHRHAGHGLCRPCKNRLTRAGAFLH